MSPVVAPRLHHCHAAHQGFVGHLDQALSPPRDVADEIHAARIAVPAIDDERDVDVDDVAVLQRLAVGQAVAHDVIDGGADRLAVTAVVQRRRVDAVIPGEIEDEIVDLFGAHARLHQVGHGVERFGGQAAGLAHALEGVGTVQFDLAGLAAGNGDGIDECHDTRIRGLVIWRGRAPI